MKIKFLGTGGSIGTPEIGCKCQVCTSNDIKDRRTRASVLLSTQGKRILIDCGPDFKAQIINEPFAKLDAVLLTHEHYDHVSGIDDLRTFGKFGDVDIYTNHLTSDALRKRIPYCFAAKKYPGVPSIDLQTVDRNQPFYVDGIEIMPVTVMHYLLPVFGYRIGSFAYLTDVKSIPEEEYAKLKDLDVLVISALRHEEHISHQTIAEAVEQVKRIAPKQAYFIHMSHSMGLHAEEDAKLPKGMNFAYDGLELTI